VGRNHLIAHKAMEVRDGTLLDLLENLDAFRRPERFEQFVLACEADSRGRKGLENRDYPQADILRRAFQAAATAKLDEQARTGLDGPQIAARLRQERLARISQARRQDPE
jgi:tRNA nucleotidyltransferase (CCA-adding enzyme)